MQKSLDNLIDQLKSLHGPSLLLQVWISDSPLKDDDSAVQSYFNFFTNGLSSKQAKNSNSKIDWFSSSEFGTHTNIVHYQQSDSFEKDVGNILKVVDQKKSNNQTNVLIVSKNDFVIPKSWRRDFNHLNILIEKI